MQSEVLAVIYAVHNFELFLYNQVFTIRTDCKSLVQLYNQRKAKSIFNRWWLNLQNLFYEKNFSPVFETIDGKNNSDADLLSKLINTLDDGR